MRKTCLTLLVLAPVLLASVVQAQGRHPSATQRAELTPSDPANKDWFGISIAVSGSTTVVGDYDANIESFGAAYVYVKPGNGWGNMTQTAKLTASDNGDGFGTSVAIDGNIIVLGA